MQGWRSSMEDTHICQLVDMPRKDEYGMLFGVFDGHGGAEVADYAQKNFKKTFESQQAFKKGDYKVALNDCMLELDK